MNSHITPKAAANRVYTPGADPREAEVRLAIRQLQTELKKLERSGLSDSLDKNKLKNLQAQLKKKNADLAGLVDQRQKNIFAAAAAKANVETKWPFATKPPVAPGTAPSVPAPAAHGQSFATLGERVNGRLPKPLASRKSLETIGEEPHQDALGELQLPAAPLQHAKQAAEAPLAFDKRHSTSDRAKKTPLLTIVELDDTAD